MAEFYESKLNNSRDRADRYRNCSILKDNETGESILSTREIPDIYTSSEDIYHRVESNENHRLDLIAYKHYKNPNLWWVIAQANNIFDPFQDLEVGTLLRIPNITRLYGNNGILL